MNKITKQLDIAKRSQPRHRCCHCLIERADEKFIDCLCQGADKILTGDIPVTSKQFDSLEPYKKQLIALSSGKKKNPRQKKKILQTGGFLPALAAPILAVAIPSLLELFKKLK